MFSGTAVDAFGRGVHTVQTVGAAGGTGRVLEIKSAFTGSTGSRIGLAG